MRIEPDMLILVADGRKILLLRNKGTVGTPDLVVEYGEEQPNPPDRDQKTDAQGQRPGSIGPGQASAGETDYHQQTENRFAVHAAELLNQRALQNGFGKLVVVAAPATLGLLRPRYHQEVKARLVAEMAKDMTGTPVDRIAAYLSELEPAVG
ncbi:MAG TPA: host attachment family protein [Sphingobium sp.]|uniref:host attachment family protein n=1 Tax=Sphingobium sp. TaxID=1912891 RepID=UPI002ED5B9E5